MSTINQLNYKIKELQSYAVGANLCVKNIKTATYPISVEFYEKQIDMFSEDVNDVPPTLCFIFDDEMRIVTSDNFKTNEATFNKLKKLSKEINHLYLKAFREDVGVFLDAIQDKVAVPSYIKRYFDNLLCEAETDAT